MSEHLEAVALGLEASEIDSPPTVRVRGTFSVADTIVALARRNGIPVIVQDEFVTAISDVPVDTPIPRQLFKAAAILLAKVGALSNRHGGRAGALPNTPSLGIQR